MGWLRSWWKNTSKPLRAAVIISLAILIVLLIGGYFLNWDWTGFGPYTPPKSNFQREKTLWDWLQLFFIPAAIAFGIWWLNRLQQQRDQEQAQRHDKADHDAAEKRAQIEREAAEKRAQTEREIALDNQREAALQVYIDSMSELLLHEKLRESDVDDCEVRKIGRVRTLTVLPRLDGKRKGSVLQFLYEAGLISGDKDKVVIHLHGADLNGARLTRILLNGANLSRVDLNEAMMYRAILTNATLELADLRGANIREADLIRCNLSNADLTEADLSGAILISANLQGAIGTTPEQLNKAQSLQGAIMPDGTKHA